MSDNNPPVVAFLLLLPGVAGFVAAAFYILKYQSYRKKNFSVRKRLIGDLLGPLSLLIKRTEDDQSLKYLMRCYACVVGVLIYAIIVILIFSKYGK